MNINPIVLTALSGLMYGGKTVPVDPIVNKSDPKPDTYITFNNYLDQDEYFSDDEPDGGNTYGTVDIFCKGNYKSLLADVKNRLRTAGFRTSTGPEQYEKDTGYYHVSLDINIENMEA
jgi:hypothetical protein